MELRDGARAYIDAAIAWKVISKKDIERALELAHNSALTHLQKSWVLSQTAGFIGIKDRERAAQVLEDAAAEARRIETGDADRPRAYFAIANVVLRINRPGVWEVMDDAIRAANSAEKFTGEDGEIVFRLVSKGTNAVHQHSFGDFDVSGIFAKLATEDYDKAVELARGLQGEAPRANAVIALARSILDDKKK
jgi:nitroreductase